MSYRRRYRHRPHIGGVTVTPAVVDTLAVLAQSPADTVTGYTVYDATRSSSRAVYRALAELTAAGLATRTAHDRESSGPPVTYTLAADPAEVTAAIAPLRDSHGHALRRTDRSWQLLAATLWAAAVSVLVWGIWSAATAPPTGCWGDGVTAIHCPIPGSRMAWAASLAVLILGAGWATLRYAQRFGWDVAASRSARRAIRIAAPAPPRRG